MNAKQLIITTVLGTLTTLSYAASVTSVSNAAQFNELKNSSSYFVAKVYTNHCPHCKKPTIENLAREWNTSDVAFAKANYHSMPGLFSAQPYKIRSVPTYLFFKDGKLVRQVVNYSVAQLKKILVDIID